MTSTELKEIGFRICNRRKQLGFTQEQIAEQMDVSIQMVSNLERGNKAIRIENLVKLSRILHISTDYILTGAYTEQDQNALLTQLSKLSNTDYQMICMMIDYCGNKEKEMP